MTASRVTAVLIGLMWPAAWAVAQRQESSELSRIRELVARAGITMTRALEIAEREVPDGRPFVAELQMEDGQAQYEIAMIAGTWRVEVEIDAADGKVLGIRRDEMETTGGRRWIFDRDPAGAPPPGWLIRQNNPTRALAEWTVEPDGEAVSPPHVLNVKTANDNRTFNLVLIPDAVYQDLNLYVKIRPNTGRDDQGGGLIWRCRDENNYYLCRINPLENNYRVYKVVDGKRTMLQSADFETPPGRWYTLRVRMKGDEIACYCDGKKWLEVRDDTFRDAGVIGLWTKADACSSFDQLEAWPISGGLSTRPQEPAADSGR